MPIIYNDISNAILTEPFNNTKYIDYNSRKYPWKLNTTYLCHDNSAIDISYSPIINNDFYIESKTSDIHLKTNTEKKIIFDSDISAANIEVNQITCKSINSTLLSLLQESQSQIELILTNVNFLDLSNVKAITIDTSNVDVSYINANIIDVSSIDVSYINANIIDVSYINANIIDVSSIDVSSINVNYVNANIIDTSSIDVSYINSNIIDASSIDVSYINVDIIHASSIDVSSIDVSYVNSYNIDASSIDVSYINTNSIDASNIDVSYINANIIDANTIDVSYINTNIIDASSFDVSYINANIIDAISIDVSSIDVSSIDVSYLNADNITCNDIILKDLNTEVFFYPFNEGYKIDIFLERMYSVCEATLDYKDSTSSLSKILKIDINDNMFNQSGLMLIIRIKNNSNRSISLKNDELELTINGNQTPDIMIKENTSIEIVDTKTLIIKIHKIEDIYFISPEVYINLN